jgi:hypothetical protein
MSVAVYGKESPGLTVAVDGVMESGDEGGTIV